MLLPRSSIRRQLHLWRVLLLHVGHMCLMCSTRTRGTLGARLHPCCCSCRSRLRFGRELLLPLLLRTLQLWRPWVLQLLWFDVVEGCCRRRVCWGGFARLPLADGDRAGGGRRWCPVGRGGQQGRRRGYSRGRGGHHFLGLGGGRRGPRRRGRGRGASPSHFLTHFCQRHSLLGHTFGSLCPCWCLACGISTLQHCVGMQLGCTRSSLAGVSLICKLAALVGWLAIGTSRLAAVSAMRCGALGHGGLTAA